MITFKYENLSLEEEQEQGELWCWFLSNLSAGTFESITKDNTRFQRLNSFFDTFIDGNDTRYIMLLLSTLKLVKSPSYLVELASKFYSDDDGLKHDVSITSIGAIPSLEATIVMVHEKVEKVDVDETDLDSYISDDDAISPSSTPLSENGQPESFQDDLSSMISNLNGISLQKASQHNTTPDQIGMHHAEPTDISYTSLSSTPSNNIPESMASSRIFGETLQLYPTRISNITTTEGNYDDNDVLILKSMLIKDSVSGKLKTAIRQTPPPDSPDVEIDEEDDWLLYDENFSLHNLQLLSLEDITSSQYNDSKILLYSIEMSPELSEQSVNELDGADYADLSDMGNENDLEVMEFQGNVTFHTDATTPILLTKTNTLNTFKSVRSELLVHGPDASYSNIVKSKSEPLSSGNRIRKSHKNRKHMTRKTSCMVM
jgi:hypothetical protein